MLEKTLDSQSEPIDATVVIIDGMALLQSIKSTPTYFSDLALLMIKLILHVAELTLSQTSIPTFPSKTLKEMDEKECLVSF